MYNIQNKMDSKNTEKKNTRISKQQKERLVDYMSNNLEFARNQFDGINSNVNCKEQWEMLKNLLNSLGGSAKSVEQWKKCWTDLKANVKKQVNARRSFINKTGGGSRSDIPRDLNSLEEQILNVITTDAVDGDSRTPESGVAEGIVVEDSMISVEILEGEYLPTPAKRINTSSQNKQPLEESMISVEILEEENLPTPAKRIKTSSKYKQSLEEARCMTNKVIQRLEAIETQNKQILRKIESIETTLSLLQ